MVEFNFSTADIKHGNKFPGPQELWQSLGRKWDDNDPRLYPTLSIDKRTPALHQSLAIGRALDAVVDGKKRVALSMVNGTGKTYVTVQLVWKIVGSGYCKRALYIGESRSYIDFVYQQIGDKSVILTQLSSTDSQGRVHLAVIDSLLDQNSDIFFQRIPSEYYDLVIVDDTAQSEQLMPALAHFSGATQILVANPSRMRSENVRSHFGQPVFSYSVRDAVEAEPLQPPAGYYAIRLEEISQLQVGLLDVRQKVANSLGSMQHCLIVTGKDIRDDGSIDLDDLDSIDLATLEETKQPYERFLLQANDILISSYLVGGSRTRVAMLPENLPARVLFSNRLTRIRVIAETVKPRDVYDFLRSDSGWLAIRKFASQSRIAIRDLSQIVVFLPKNVNKTATEELTVVSRAIRQLKTDILPILEKIEKSDSQSVESVQTLSLVAEKLRGLTHEIVDPPLAERVIVDYPMPIAIAYRRFQDARFNLFEQVPRLKDLFEAMGFFLYNLMLADTLRRLDPTKYRVEDTGARRAFNGFSMSARLDFVASLLQTAASTNSRHELFIPDLVGTSVVETD